VVAERQRRFNSEKQPVARDVFRVGILQERGASAGANPRQTIEGLLDLVAAPANDVRIKRHRANASSVARRSSGARS